MNLTELEVFVDVARRGSFVAVARDRGLDPSSVSRTVAALEASVGAKLLRRTTRTMTLTEAGALYLARLPPVLEELARMREEAASLRGEPVGTLRLTASVAFGEVCLVPLLAELMARFPRLKLELLLSDEITDFVEQRIDLAIRLRPPDRADLHAVKLRTTRYRVVASPAYLRAQGRPRVPIELSAHGCLVFALPAFRARWLFRQAQRQSGAAAGGDIEAVAIQSRLVISNALALRAAAVAGLGPALLPDWLIEPELERGALIDVFADHDITATTFATGAWLIYPGGEAPPKKTRAAIDFFRSRLTGEPPRVGRALGAKGPRPATATRRRPS